MRCSLINSRDASKLRSVVELKATYFRNWFDSEGAECTKWSRSSVALRVPDIGVGTHQAILMTMPTGNTPARHRVVFGTCTRVFRTSASCAAGSACKASCRFESTSLMVYMQEGSERGHPMHSRCPHKTTYNFILWSPYSSSALYSMWKPKLISNYMIVIILRTTWPSMQKGKR